MTDLTDLADPIFRDIKALIERFHAELGFAGDAPIEPDTPFAALGLESLHLMEFGFRVSEAFQIELSRLAVRTAFESVGSLARVVDAAVRERAAHSA